MYTSIIGHQGKSEEPGPLVTWSERGVVVRHLPNWPNWIFRLTPVAVGDRTIVASVEISAPTGEPVTVYAYKRVPIGTLLRLASDPTAAVRAVVAGLVPDADALKRRPYSTEHLCAVIDVYRYAISQDAPPRATLAELFDVADKTVDRWLRRARDRGLLHTWDEERHAGEIKEPS